MSLTLLGLAFLLGIKHSYDADHLIAVSTILHRMRSVASSVKVGVSWALGHMLTATIITVILFAFKESVLSAFLSYFEMVVAVLLIGLGVFALRTIIFHAHVHAHGIRKHTHFIASDPGKEDHIHRYMFGVGIMHGLASNDELLTLLATSLGITTLGGTLLGIGVFSLGVIFGMMAFCAAFSVPWLNARSETAQKVLVLITGLVSIMYGTSILLGV